MTKVIKLSRGKQARVCDCHYGLVKDYKWYFHKLGYAVTSQSSIKMHRLIIDAPQGFQVDHKDLDKLNNRCSNLRLATSFDNMHNKTITKSNKSGYKGVHWHKGTRKWRVQITVNYKSHHIGLFESIEEAVRAYNKAAKSYYGEFARLN